MSTFATFKRNLKILKGKTPKFNNINISGDLNNIYFGEDRACSNYYSYDSLFKDFSLLEGLVEGTIYCEFEEPMFHASGTVMQSSLKVYSNKFN